MNSSIPQIEVSVIIPVYNAENYIFKAVESALQHEEVKEVILAEDGSEDDSYRLCLELSNKYDLVKLYRHPDGENLGAGATRNLALSKATKEFIAFLDADDYYLSNKFKTLRNLVHSKIEFEGLYEAIGAHFYSENAKKRFNKSDLTTLDLSYLNKHGYFQTLICGRGFTSLDGIILKKESLKKIGPFDEQLKQLQDTDFIYRIALKCKMIPGNLKSPVAIRGVHEDNRIHNINESKRFRKILGYKWLKISKTHNWNTKIYTSIIFSIISTWKGFSRFKLPYFGFFLISHPFLFGKIKFNEVRS